MSTIIALISFAASVWIFFGLVDPAYQDVKSLREEKSSYEAALSSANELEQVKSALVAKYNAMDPNEVKKLETLLPDSVDSVRLIIEINSIASRYGLSIQNTKIDTGTAMQSSENTDGNAGVSDKKYAKASLQFSVSGPYANFIAFLADLERNLKVVDVESISLKPVRGNLYQYDLKVISYWLK